MGLLSNIRSAISGAARAVGRGVSSVVSAVGRGISAVASAGSRLIQKSVSAVKHMASKVSDWKKLIGAMWDGAKKGASFGAKKGPLGMLFGGLIGAGLGGFFEWRRQAAAHDLAQENENIRDEDFSYEYEDEIDADIQKLGATITNFLPALQRKFSSKAPVESFEEYLRIDVSMAFIRDFLTRLETMEDASQITNFDRKFIQLIDKLALDKPMSEEELQEFDGMVKQRFGKTLLLIGSERLFSLWTNEERTLKDQVNFQRTDISRAEVFFRELDSRAEYGLSLNEEETQKHKQLKQTIEQKRSEFSKAKSYLEDIRLMTGVAEGLLQSAEAENSGSQLREADRARADRAGAIMINAERSMELSETNKIDITQEDKQFLEQYVDLHMPAAIKRQKQHANEFNSNPKPELTV